jgi:tetratricopeptide (TPR) repeat protein
MNIHQQIKNANHYFIQNNLQKSLELYNEILLTFPHPTIYCNRGIVLYKLNNIEDSNKSFKIAIQLDPYCTMAYFFMNQINMNLGKGMLENIEEKIIDIQYYIHFTNILNETKNHLNHSISSNGNISTVNKSPVTIPDVTNNETKPVQLEIIKKESRPVSNNEYLQYVIQGNQFTNNKNYEEAKIQYERALELNPLCIQAFIGLAVYYLSKEDLEKSEEYFNRAIAIDENNPEIWKHHFQLSLKKNNTNGTLSDLTKAISFLPNETQLKEFRGNLYLKNGYYKQSFLDLYSIYPLINRDTEHSLNIYHAMGLCLYNMGYFKNAITIFSEIVQRNSDFYNAYIHLALSYRDIGDIENAFQILNTLEKKNPNLSTIYSVKSHMYYLIGNAQKSISTIDRIPIINDSSYNRRIDDLYLKAIAKQSRGELYEALDIFNEILEAEPKHYSWYQKEICLYWIHHNYIPFEQFTIDDDIYAPLKEAIARKSEFSVFEKFIEKYTQQNSVIQPESSSNISQKYQQMQNNPNYSNIIQYAENLGHSLQYHSPGFIKNKRQYRMAGLAMLESNEILHKYIQQVKTKYNIPNIYVSDAESLAELYSIQQNRIIDTIINDMKNNPNAFTWRKFMNIIVKWRQISEPNDSVWWIDQLTEESYNIGFGLQTPMYSNQLKIARYYPYYNIAFELMKHYTLKTYPLTDEMIQKIQNAKHCGQLREVINHDYFVIVPCESLVNSNKRMEGTRLTLLKKGDDKYEFMIKTPVTPQRWQQFDEELTIIWSNIIFELCQTTINNQKLAQMFFYFYYYWTCFAPISRGTAAVGFIALKGLFIQIGIELDFQLPENKQIDWEAILRSNVNDFVKYTNQWLLDSNKNKIQIIPSISTLLPTLQDRLIILNLN